LQEHEPTETRTPRGVQLVSMIYDLDEEQYDLYTGSEVDDESDKAIDLYPKTLTS
jgi:hypothetical protein